ADRLCEHALSVPPHPGAATRPPAQAGHPPAQAAAARQPPGRSPTSLTFTEEMKGFVALDVDDPRAGARLGRDRRQRLSVRLTITIDDVDGFVAHPEHPARADGWVFCEMLGGTLPVRHGWFKLFTREGDGPARSMRYGLHFADATGRPIT